MGIVQTVLSCGNASESGLGLIQDTDFAGALPTKSTSGSMLCILGSHAFVPTSRTCKKRTAVSHNSTEAEVISLDAGLRLEGIPALDVWDIEIDVFEGAW